MLQIVFFIVFPVVLNAHSNRIIGGETVERNSRPFQVALYSRVGASGAVGFCGGALVAPRWVITAAHCLYHNGQKVDHIQAILGAHSLYDRYENGRRIATVDDIEVHPAWDQHTFANDIALLRLTTDVQITDTIDVVRLPYLRMAEFNFAGRGGTASGWGIAAPDVPFVSPVLRSKLMTIMTDQLCNNNYMNLLPPNTVCAFSNRGGTCKGDNGGPLTIEYNIDEDTSETILIGVASFVSSGGCNDATPSVFTRVQRYLQWISQVTGIQLE